MSEEATFSEIDNRVVELIDESRDELVDLAVELGRIPSPHGKELRVASYVRDWLDDAGIPSRLQPIISDSANVVGMIPGIGDGSSLILNAHLDTGPDLPGHTGSGSGAESIYGAWADARMLYGFGLVNDKAQLAAFMVAARAILRADLGLSGDIYVTGVAFETGRPSAGGRQGIDFPGEGFGTWWLVNRGVVADFALVGETSGFGVITTECGAVSLDITLTGRDIYTPRLERPGPLEQHPSAVVKIPKVVEVLEAWAVEYERRETIELPEGTIVPKAQIVRIDGHPGAVRLEFDIRILPRVQPQSVRREVVRLLEESNIDARVELVQWSRGYHSTGAELLVDAIESGHRLVLGEESPPPPSAEMSMWRDMNVFNELGIPSICYGPPRQAEPYSHSGDRAIKIDDLVAATKVYALAATRIAH